MIGQERLQGLLEQFPRQRIGLLGDLFLDRILHRFWAPLGGGRHAIRSRIVVFAKGRPFSKKSDFESIWESFWSQNGDHNPNYTNFRDHVGDF